MCDLMESCEYGWGEDHQELALQPQSQQQQLELDLLALPDELLVRVLATLSRLSDACNAFATCQRLYSIGLDDLYWRAVVKGRWGVRGRGLRQSAGIEVPWRFFVREKLALFREGAVEWVKREKQGLFVPRPRYTHTGTTVGRKIYYIGGQAAAQGARLSEVVAYDVDADKFEAVELTSGRVPNFARHTAVAIGRRIWVFGGYDGVGSFFGLAIFDTEERTWTYPTVHGEAPPPRSNHTAAAVGNKMYVYGGSGNTSGEYTILDDFYEFDTETMTWTRLDSRIRCPSPRVGHRMVALGHRVFLFGGGVWSAEAGWHTKFNELCIFDTRARQWLHVPRTVQSPPVCSYPFMFTLGCHIGLFGGQSLNDTAVTSELYILDTISLRWSKAEAPQLKGTAPGPRDMGVANVVDNRCFLFGGYSGGSLMSAVDFFELKFDPVAFTEYQPAGMAHA